MTLSVGPIPNRCPKSASPRAIDDLDGGALPEVIGREEEPPDQSDAHAQGRKPADPRQHRAGPIHELLWICIFP